MNNVVVGTSLDRSGPTAQRGYIDVMDGLRGVRGWAIDVDSPNTDLSVELRAGNTVIAQVLTDQPREDISLALGQEAFPGFIFEPDTLALLAEVAESQEDLVTVHIGGTGFQLSCGNGPPTVASLLADYERANDAGPQTSHIEDFETMLEELRTAGAALAKAALRPLPETLQGYIETVALDSVGHVWVVGWMRRGHLLEFSAVVSDRRKTAAAVALMTFARDDLPPNACGVIGLIASSWRPTSATTAFHVFFGGGGRFRLESNRPLRILTTAEFAQEYDNMRDRLQGDGRANSLQRMLGALETWGATRTGAQTYATETSIDRVLVVPGLGCLIEGWVMSPMKRVTALRLRLGGAVMTAQTDALYWKPRPDLLSGYPGTETLVNSAGFVGLFTGDSEPDDFADPVFKVVFEGGASANWKLAPHLFRRLGHSAAVEDALRFFPALLEESFFPRFAKAAIQAERGEMGTPVILSSTPTKRAVVLVLPEDRCDLFLAFEELTQQCRLGNVPEGVVLISSAQANRSDALWLFREFKAAQNVKCSLVVIDDATHGLSLLPGILRDIGVIRFVYVGASIFLTDSGWRQAGAFLRAVTQDLMVLGLTSGEAEHRDPQAEISARAFGWGTAPFNRWSATAAAFLGGYHRDNGLFNARVAHIVHRGGARSSRPSLATRIEEAVNETVYRMSAPVASPAP